MELNGKTYDIEIIGGDIVLQSPKQDLVFIDAFTELVSIAESEIEKDHTKSNRYTRDRWGDDYPDYSNAKAMAREGIEFYVKTHPFKIVEP